MAKPSIQYVCSSCGAKAPQMLGRCPVCGEWGTYEEEILQRSGLSAKRSVSARGLSGEAGLPKRLQDIVATDAQFAGCYFDGLPEQPIERVSMKNVTITFDPNAEAGQAAMADNRPLVKKLAIYAENVKEIDLHNVKIEGYEGERLHFANVGHFEED